MRTQTISFPDQRSLCAFPAARSELEQGISELNFKHGCPVMVLIGGVIDADQADATRRAVNTIAGIAEDMQAVIICGGTDMGVMAEIGRIRGLMHYKFPLMGIAPEELVAWPGGLQNTKFLWWGKQRWQLESHYSHFILVPGSQFGDESPWIVDTATILSKGYQSVTILINGGEVSRKDIELSLGVGRQVIALRHTGRLADEFSKDPNDSKLITVISADDEQQIIKVVQAALSANKID